MSFWRRRLSRHWRRRRERRDARVATLLRTPLRVRLAAPPDAGRPYWEGASPLAA